MNEEITTEEFLNKLKKRNKDAFHLLYENLKIPLYGIIFSIIKDDDRTADIIQDTFIKVIKNIGQLEDIRKIKFWVFRIAINLSINALKKDKKFSYAGDDLEAIAAQMAPSHFALRPRNAEDVEALYFSIQEQVALLPLKQRLVFTLKYVDNLKETEICEVLNIPVGTVKSRLNAARNKIKDAINLEEE
jgi:RNA polymerase sigma-70 factor (ECF subfamily)